MIIAAVERAGARPSDSRRRRAGGRPPSGSRRRQAGGRPPSGNGRRRAGGRPPSGSGTKKSQKKKTNNLTENVNKMRSQTIKFYEIWAQRMF